VQQAAVPAQEGAGGDKAVSTQPTREVLGKGGEHGAFRPGQPRADPELAAQHRILMAQREQLDILGLH
jgi:hypothetical protein